ncbi:MAG: YgiQ family radical SAM protein [Kiritimatiellae bacterium]|jgi:uncharacterized radical SAM protein YgiQ|nr:YgiQ family radical SAM protein [Kiritimatiellia bacterium]
MFIPTTQEELEKREIKQLDIILITGDAYIDSPFSGVSVIARVLESNGYSIGIIGQPDLTTKDITRLGEPRLFWGVTGGCIDSMVANYTALKKKRNDDDYTPGGINDKRPDRACMAYTNLIRRNFKETKPIVLGGLEASLRRLAHYDYWNNKVRKSILLDAKAEVLVYGMSDRTIVQLADAFANNSSYTDIRGICYISNIPPTNQNVIELKPFDKVSKDKQNFIEFFKTFYENNDPINAKGLYQKFDTRYVIQNPPAEHLSENELDDIYKLPFANDVHPYYKKMGKVKAMETIKFSISTHRGCYGECNFCSIAVHQGRRIRSRSEQSIISEAKSFLKDKSFKGRIGNVGAATANMYKIDCNIKQKSGACKNKRCMYPTMCKDLPVSHKAQIDLLNDLSSLPGIKQAVVASGVRYDLINADNSFGTKYLENLIKKHISGQMKIAPEHTSPEILDLMGKPSAKVLKDFKNKFYNITKKLNNKMFLTYYFIAAYPGCSYKEMHDLKRFVSNELRLTPQQVQIFTPLPSTWAAVMYYTELNPFTNEKLIVAKDPVQKRKQKDILTS